MRLDLYLVKNGFYPSRGLAQESIKEGKVKVLVGEEEWKTIKKLNFSIKPECCESEHHESERHGPEHHGSEHHGSERHGSERHGPERHGSEHHGSEHHGSEHHGSEHHGSERHGSERHGSERKLKNKTKQRIDVEIQERFWVSRAAQKIQGAFSSLDLSVKDKIILDLGQSTGGFTQFFLHEGALKVIGLDVGKDQLHESLRSDHRVEFYEGQDARNLSFLKGRKIHFFAADLSFISLLKVAPEIKSLFQEVSQKTSQEASVEGLSVEGSSVEGLSVEGSSVEGLSVEGSSVEGLSVEGLFLVKPQFEVGKNNIGKGGIVKDREAFIFCEKMILEGLEDLGFKVLNYLPSQVKGKNGNQEFICHVAV